MSRTACCDSSSSAGPSSDAVVKATSGPARANGATSATCGTAAISAARSASVGVARRPGHGERDALGDLAPVVVLDVLVGRVGLLTGRHRLGAGPGQVGAEQRRGEREQHRRRSDRDQHRAAHHAASQPQPAVRRRPRRPGRGGSSSALIRGPSTASSAGTTSSAIAAREDADRRAGHADRVEEPLRHQHQRGHRAGDGQTGEQRRPAGGRDRPPVRLARCSDRASTSSR